MEEERKRKGGSVEPRENVRLSSTRYDSLGGYAEVIEKCTIVILWSVEVGLSSLTCFLYLSSLALTNVCLSQGLSSCISNSIWLEYGYFCDSHSPESGFRSVATYGLVANRNILKYSHRRGVYNKLYMHLSIQDRQPKFDGCGPAVITSLNGQKGLLESLLCQQSL